MPYLDLTLALGALLLTPGPTNTLMAVAGAERGWRAGLALIPAELLAYLAITLPLAVAGAGLMAAVPGLKPAVTGAAALWVLVLAVRMWRVPKPEATVSVTPARVLVTTLLNPKALIIGLVLLPGDPLAPRAALFAGLIICVAAAWLWLGARLARRGASQPPQPSLTLRRGAAVWLAVLSAGLAFRAMAG
jgi:threonine/homoserine/homoserine lactone efflux protein